MSIYDGLRELLQWDRSFSKLDTADFYHMFLPTEILSHIYSQQRPLQTKLNLSCISQNVNKLIVKFDMKTLCITLIGHFKFVTFTDYKARFTEGHKRTLFAYSKIDSYFHE
jgi:hypothetical protein